MENKKISLIVLAIILGVGIAVFIFIKMPVKIDLNDYVEVKFEGYNTAGKANYVLNKDKLLDDILEKTGGTKEKDITMDNLLSSIKDSSKYYNLLSDVNVNLSNKEGLKNGDKVTISFSYNKTTAKNAGVRFVSKNKDYTVAGLEEIEEIDPFKFINVYFDGVSPNGKIHIEEIQDASISKYLDKIYFEAEKESGIKDGDIVKVYAKSDEDVKECGFTLSKMEQEYKCENIDSNLEDVSQLSEDNLNSMKERSKDYIEADFADIDSDYKLKYSDLKYEGNYLLDIYNSSYGSNDNELILIYSTTINTNKKDFDDNVKNKKIYIPVLFSNVIIDSTKNVNYDENILILGETDINLPKDYWSNYIKGYTDGNFMYKDLITKNKDEYKCSVLGDISKFGK